MDAVLKNLVGTECCFPDWYNFFGSAEKHWKRLENVLRSFDEAILQLLPEQRDFLASGAILRHFPVRKWDFSITREDEGYEAIPDTQKRQRRRGVYRAKFILPKTSPTISGISETTDASNSKRPRVHIRHESARGLRKFEGQALSGAGAGLFELQTIVRIDNCCFQNGDRRHSVNKYRMGGETHGLCT